MSEIFSWEIKVKVVTYKCDMFVYLIIFNYQIYNLRAVFVFTEKEFTFDISFDIGQ